LIRGIGDDGAGFFHSGGEAAGVGRYDDADLIVRNLCSPLCGNFAYFCLALRNLLLM